MRQWQTNKQTFAPDAKQNKTKQKTANSRICNFLDLYRKLIGNTESVVQYRIKNSIQQHDQNIIVSLPIVCRDFHHQQKQTCRPNSFFSRILEYSWCRIKWQMWEKKIHLILEEKNLFKTTKTKTTSKKYIWWCCFSIIRMNVFSFSDFIF